MAFSTDITRRGALLSGLAFTTFIAHPLLAQGTAIHVVKGTGCECCDAWVAYLRDAGFAVTDEERYGTLLMMYKTEVGVPQKMISCHTGMVADYVLEGHVPAADIRRLLAERPDAIGLTVPGMPYGSPGMGPEAEREAYEVFLIRQDGSTEVFTRYDAMG
ncbi:DUF411 domain-containing protein [Rubellimicrobium sp. CFH 75288]|uniref:DUF411 domain-containing protein n=1 Tax=Rubellimicrobium sp. CFH 75288 TaxID=2697034 RepID=UPI001412F4F4|nr:DUF411 domain-containing protein [Rubellimicrobium sp. CFH 75288]NAZ38264.1 DUF411 domain-containing protein [Rubellimicrobium sp. CFH 75288]